MVGPKGSCQWSLRNKGEGERNRTGVYRTWGLRVKTGLGVGARVSRGRVSVQAKGKIDAGLLE